MKWLKSEEYEKLLFDLANLRDDGVQWFSRRWGRRVSIGNDDDPIRLRDDLRKVWTPGVSLADKQKLLQGWLERKPGRGFDQLAPISWFVSLQFGRILPQPGDLRATLLIAVLAYWRKFAICKNPECPARFFIRKRVDSKCCSYESCVKYQQSIFALASYYKVGAQRRRQSRTSQKATSARK
jgi:hypothetical protein